MSGMSPTITIRLAESQDHEIVGLLTWELLKELFPQYSEQFAPDVFLQASRMRLTEGTGFWSLLAKWDGEVVAILNLKAFATKVSGGSRGEVAALYIKPQLRAKGIGAQMMQAAKSFSNEQGWSSLKTGTPSLDTWQRTIDFYLDPEVVPNSPSATPSDSWK
jgi:GNAT superfamily N-acetyltransferase